MYFYRIFCDKLDKFLQGMVKVLFVVMIFLAILQVVFRYIIGQSLSFSEEFNRYIFVWSVMLASAVCVKHKSHAAVTFFINYFNRQKKFIVEIIVYVISLIFLGFLFVEGVNISKLVLHQPAAATGISMVYAYAAIPAGAFFMILFTIESFLDSVKKHNGQHGISKGA